MLKPYFNPSHCVNKRRSGTSKTSCFVSDMSEPFHAFPMEGKKVVQEVCMPFRNITAANPLAYLIANSKYSAVPSPNSPMICLGKH